MHYLKKPSPPKKKSHCTKNEASIKDLFSKCDQETVDLVTFTEEIFYGKLYFLCSVTS